MMNLKKKYENVCKMNKFYKITLSVMLVLVLFSIGTATTVIDSDSITGLLNLESTNITTTDINNVNFTDSLNERYSYLIYTDGTTVYAKNGATGKIDYSSTNLSVLNSIDDKDSTKKSVLIRTGTYNLNATLNLNNSIKTFCGTGRDDVLFEKNFNGIGINSTVINMGRFELDGNSYTGVGIQYNSPRGILHRINIHHNGGDGIKITDEHANVNFWALRDITSSHNGGNGVNITGTAGSPNVNAGSAYSLDLRSNTKNGLHIVNAIDNIFMNILTEFNDWGIYLDTGANGNHFTGVYCEADTSGTINLQGDHNFIYGIRSGAGHYDPTITGANNVYLDRDDQRLSYPYYLTPMAFHTIVIDSEKGTSGAWELFEQNRHLHVMMKGTGTTPLYINFTSNSGAGDTRILTDQIALDSSAATTLGSVNGKVPLYNRAGSIIGYIPLYDSIT